MSTAKWKIGDVVKLRSGGITKMTITRIYDDGDVQVVWWHEGDIKNANLPADAVEAA